MTRPTKSRRKRIALWAAASLLLLAMYLSSLGPWVYAANANVLPFWMMQALHYFYLPLELVARHTDFFEENPIGRAY
ncbi:MAG: hypothetical protein DWQ34_25985 [Planctomycetota bacterium]|mgnify:FL=1|nr:MAG: hypothetical protein DWQ34_25985 [Planctomycetota bacterium]REK21661.1 MAG: hypothetical protein DWQ41_20535 [Planctomycetota bacterium]REK32778.1 MAG: hypothetical protein DWQ45_16915 [Planctomycetota bacterium]